MKSLIDDTQKYARTVDQLVTELLSVENELSNFKEILSASSDAILITAPDSKIIYVNPAWEKLTGYSYEEVIGKNPSILQSGKTPREIYDKLWKALKRNKPFTTEEAVDKRKDGTEYQIRSAFFPVVRNGKAVLFVQLQHDITARKKEEELQTRFKTLIELSNDPIFSVDPNLGISSWNPAAEKMYGYKPEEILGKPIDILIPKDRKQELKMIYANKVKQFIDYETERLTKEGQIISVATTISPINDSKGNFAGFSVIHRDISEKKKMDEFKKNFLSSVSHELKTPITTLKLLNQVLKKKIKKGQTLNSSDINFIDQEFNRLTELVNDLLDISRFETGKFRLSLDQVNLSSLVTKTVKKMHLLSPKQKIISDVTKEIWVVADSVRIEQVLTNFITNAIKHSDSNKPIIVKIEMRGKNAVVSVKDFGIGIPKKLHHQIFEQFYQTQINSKEGFGLGLFISKNIIEKHKGKIWVESVENEGSTFYFQLPILPSEFVSKKTTR